MKDRKLVQRMISLMFAMTFLGVLFSGSDISEYDNRLCRASYDTKITVREVSRLVMGVCSQELLPSNNAKITHTDTARPQNRLKYFEKWFKDGCILFAAAEVLYLLLFQALRQVKCLKKYIIKYIHDQDGYKNRPSLYFYISDITEEIKWSI